MIKKPKLFKTPLEFLIFYDDDIRSGMARLYDWQVDLLQRFGKERTNIEEIVRIACKAANGSGKSKYIIAPCACWIAFSFERSLTVITSSSAAQLDTQTERYIDILADNINRKSREDFGGINMWDNVKRVKRFLPHGSYIDLFATDEAKRAEGRHPLVIDGEFAIIVDEGKSVSDDIYGALMRCTGATRRMDVSSTGTTSGYFYESCTKPELGWYIKTVTAFDCPHIPSSEIEYSIRRHGLYDPLVRSSIFCEFTSAEGKVVVTKQAIDDCYKLWENQSKVIDLNHPLALKFGEHSGLDLSAGGDEIVLSIWDGTVQRAQETAIFRNTSLGTDEIIHWIRKHKLNPLKIWADDGGIGRGIIDNLHRLEFPVNRVLNQWRAMDKTRYANRGTENWFSFKRFIEEGMIYLIKDGLLLNQLINRYYKVRDNNNQIILESKEQARANGHPSPDRADAAILAWHDYQFPLNLEQLGITKKVPEDEEPEKLIKEEELLRMWQDRRDLILGVRGKILDNSKEKQQRAITELRQAELVNDQIGEGRNIVDPETGRPIESLRRRLREYYIKQHRN